ncbi:MAG: hypothetical protein HYX36_09110 [Rhizobiales bacterium]|nr:hypothetical protein [Hyphomicrobiales bacterium]
MAVAFLAAMSTSAQAQMVCGDRTVILKALNGKYQEMPNGMGLAGEKTLVELYTAKTGSWTILMTQPGGPSCIIATGQSWEQIPQPQKLTGL